MAAHVHSLLEYSGGAADIVMCAMLRIESNERLKALGFRQVLQVHDEIILEVRIAGRRDTALPFVL